MTENSKPEILINEGEAPHIPKFSLCLRCKERYTWDLLCYVCEAETQEGIILNTWQLQAILSIAVNSLSGWNNNESSIM